MKRARRISPYNPGAADSGSPDDETTLPSDPRDIETQSLIKELEIQRAELHAQNAALVEAQRLVEDSRDLYSDLFDFAPVSYVTLDTRGIIRNLNLTAAALLGITRQFAIGMPFAGFERSEHQSLFWDHMARCRENSLRLTTELEVKLRFRESPIPVQLITAPPLRSSESDEFRTAVLDMTDRQLAEERRMELAREQSRREEAERINQAKDEFFSHLAHELRTPLNAVHGWTHLLASGRLNPADTRHAIDVIWRNVQAQVALINEMLDVSRIIRGALELRVGPVNLADLIRNGIEAFRPAAEERGITIDCLIDTTETRIEGDSDRLYQVITNLLSNAIKFTPAGGIITVTLDRIVESNRDPNDWARFTVKDTGAGIAPEDLPHVFVPFRQTQDRALGGLGLGLTIVRRLVELHGGMVRVHSDGEGCGTMFTVEVPVRSQKAGRTRRVDPNVFRDEEPRRLLDVKVLVVDDDSEATELVRRMLEPLDARVTTVHSAAEAFDKLRMQRPDVLVSDLAMPEEDGISLIRRVRGLPADQGGDVPAIALTAFAGAGDEDRVLWAGFQTFVAKPVDARTLAGLIDSLTALSRKSRR